MSLPRITLESIWALAVIKVRRRQGGGRWLVKDAAVLVHAGVFRGRLGCDCKCDAQERPILPRSYLPLNIQAEPYGASTHRAPHQPQSACRR